MSGKKEHILLELRDTLRFHRELGILEYPENEDLRRFMQVAPQRKPAAVSGPGINQQENAGGKGLDALAGEIAACARCGLSGAALGRVAGTGKEGAFLMLVGDWSAQSGTFSPDTLFGREEDEMLSKMTAAMGLDREQVYVTNCLKCCPANSQDADGSCEESCFPFLAREIAVVRPRVICAMGETAARLILRKKQPLTRMRGHFGSYRQPSGEAVPVMPTFHPRFLLQHPELKKATWNDLQAVKKLLDGK